MQGFAPPGFSDQINIPSDVHDETMDIIVDAIEKKYGEDLVDIAYKGIKTIC